MFNRLVSHIPSLYPTLIKHPWIKLRFLVEFKSDSQNSVLLTIKLFLAAMTIGLNDGSSKNTPIMHSVLFLTQIRFFIIFFKCTAFSICNKLCKWAKTITIHFIYFYFIFLNNVWEIQLWKRKKKVTLFVFWFILILVSTENLFWVYIWVRFVSVENI